MSIPYKTVTRTVTIAAGASLSGAMADTGGYTLVGVSTDAAWDTNAVSFQGSVDGTNYFNVYDNGTEVSIAGVVASTYNGVDAFVPFLPWRYLKVRSGTSGAAVNQVDATVVTLYLMAM